MPRPPFSLDLPSRLKIGYERVKTALLAERNARGHWEGELSTSALSTATAVMALEMVRRGGPPALAPDTRTFDPVAMDGLIERGLQWIAGHQNPDGGWGDTRASFSNISTTMLCHAAIHATSSTSRFSGVAVAAGAYIDRAGGVAALRARYGADKTFSIPILTQCALAGLVEWREVAPLPFELACLPTKLYKWMRLPVVSYALPALIAIGQVRHHFVKPANPLLRAMRGLSVGRSLKVLERIQPASGGFLEAAPLTSFVTMSLAGMGLAGHSVAQRGTEFLIRSARPDGSWPIDTNLATWVTTLSINALGPDLPADAAGPLQDWLLDQQYREVHPYTNADPGGWAWTDLTGGVPDADDTSGAMLALMNLERPAAAAAGVASRGRSLSGGGPTRLVGQTTSATALMRATGWLLDLQNGDGGWPTFCRGWGALPFDRSAPDLTAHAIRGLSAFGERVAGSPAVEARPRDRGRNKRIRRGIERGFAYLARTQRSDGSWLPLWFGNQHVVNDENPTYGTARVLAAYRDAGRADDSACRRGLEWLRRAQNRDGGWGGAPGIISSNEETALACEVLLSFESEAAHMSGAMAAAFTWLIEQLDGGKLMNPSPIGFYFARLWYFETLYPMIFAVAALRRASERAGGIYVA